MTQQGIRLTRVRTDEEGGAKTAWLLSQNRPRIADSLTQLDLEEALTRIPLLLPICSAAQLGAATAAVDALAEGNDTVGTRPDYRLLREQGLAHAWRWLVTWPPLLGRQPDLLRLRGIRAAEDDQQLAQMLRACVPGLESVRDVNSLKQWAGAGDCPAALLLHQMLTAQHQTGNAQAPGDADSPAAVVRLLDQSMIYDTVRAAYAKGDEVAKDLLNSVSAAVPSDVPVRRFESVDNVHSVPCYVGPLAAREYLFESGVVSHQPFAMPVKILIAQLFDAVDVIRNLASGGFASLSAWSMTLPCGEVLGIGSAMTSRGPLFHLLRQTLGDKERGVASAWQILAPTDWHFRDSTLLQRLLPESATGSALRTVLAALDPCCAADVRSPSVFEDGDNA